MLKRTLPFFPILAILAFAACTPSPSSAIPPGAATSIVQTMTATLWTPTPSTTPEPDSRTIIDMLNSVIIDADPLNETIAAKFSVLDIRFPIEPTSKKVLTLQIDVECEWIFTDSCTPEEAFVNLMHGFALNNKMMDKIRAQVPATVENVEVTSFDHRVPNGKIVVRWQDVINYAAGKINGNQLGARIVRLGH